MKKPETMELLDPILYLGNNSSIKGGEVEEVDVSYLIELNNFFKQLRSPTSTRENPRYKRSTASPLRYAGGKSLAVGFIAELLPRKKPNCIVSPFFGGGSFEISISNALDIDVLGSDIFNLLVNYWQQHLSNPRGLSEKLKQFSPTPECYKEVREKLRSHWNNEKIITDALELAAIYFYNHNCSYGPHFLGHPSSVYLQKDRYEKMLEKVKNFNAPKVQVHEASFEEVIRDNRSAFLYCDPPYYLSGEMFIGMYPHRNFPIHHNGFQHDLLRELLVSHKGKWILSYNDCAEIREFYKGFKMSTPRWQYTFGQGDTRLGQNRRNGNGTHIKKSHELLIWKD